MDHQRAQKLVASAALLVMLMFPALARAGFLASECDAILDNLVLNCGFETGDFTDWTMTPAAVGSHFGVESIHPHTGTEDAFFMGAADPDSISQSIPTTPGAIYTVTFWLANDENSDIFSATFGGTTLLSFFNMAPFGYTEYSQNVMATSASTLLAFSGSAPVDTLFLDDVSVVAATVPEPASLALLLSAVAAFSVVRRRLSKS